jgi:hypothetical protein
MSEQIGVVHSTMTDESDIVSTDEGILESLWSFRLCFGDATTALTIFSGSSSTSRWRMDGLR